MDFQKYIECFFQWEPITPSNLILLFAALVALFGPRIWKCVDDRRNRAALRGTIVKLLENLKSDLIRIRDERNGQSSASREDNEIIDFSETSIGEISHYFYVFESLIVPNLVVLKLPKESLTVELFDHYRKNIAVVNKKQNLTYATVSLLISRADAAILELNTVAK